MVFRTVTLSREGAGTGVAAPPPMPLPEAVAVPLPVPGVVGCRRAGPGHRLATATDSVLEEIG